MKKLLCVILYILLLPSIPGVSESLEAPAAPVSDGLLEESVSIGEPALPGTLTLPGNHASFSAPLPAAVLLHGSGPSDRDETVGETHLFRDLAQELAAQGIAVLRYDKRTYVYGSTYTQEDLIGFTVEEESIQDAVAAAELLKADPRIDPQRIFLIGHSLGALIAPRTAWENPGLFAGIVMLSGTPKTLGEIVLSQNQAVVDALPIAEKAIGQWQMAMLRQEWNTLLQCTAEQAKTKTVFGQPGYYFWEMAQCDTAFTLQSLSIPALIINGGQDFQVVDEDGINAWRALEMPESVRLVYYPILNHLLMDPQAPQDVKGTVQEYFIPCRVSGEIISDIAQFILD